MLSGKFDRNLTAGKSNKVQGILRFSIELIKSVLETGRVLLRIGYFFGFFQQLCEKYEENFRKGAGDPVYGVNYWSEFKVLEALVL